MKVLVLTQVLLLSGSLANAGYHLSDKRLKAKISAVGRSKHGIPIHHFEYAPHAWSLLPEHPELRNIQGGNTKRAEVISHSAGGVNPGTFEGVLAQDLIKMAQKDKEECWKADPEADGRRHCGLGHKGAVCIRADGYYEVDYSKIDVEMRHVKGPPGTVMPSDMRIKTDVQKVAKSKDGIPIYHFKYKDEYQTVFRQRFDAVGVDNSAFAEGKFEGVMAQDLLKMSGRDDRVCSKHEAGKEQICEDKPPPHERSVFVNKVKITRKCGLGYRGAVCVGEDGIYEVDYSKIDVTMRKL